VPDGESGGVGPGGYRHQPHYDHALLAIWSLYARLHDELKDYSYAQAAAAHERGTPFVRPMFAAYPERPEYRDLFSQYLYGPDILVRPVWEQGAEQVEVHIPPRGEWVDAWSGQTMTPGQTVQVAVPEHKIPIYIRAGSQVDLGDLPARWQSAQQRTQTPPDLAALAAEVE
jgi:alpha-glucosidase (family GH31 glycosyl hydrolase)